jgi:hypothetical protein
MQLTINIKPQIMTIQRIWSSSGVVRSTKAGLVNHIIGNRSLTFSSAGNGYMNGTRSTDSDTIRVFNLEKRRPVVATVTDKKLLKKGIKRVVVTPGHWVAHVYDFPFALLKAAGLQVKQGARTFTISSKK